MRILFITRIHPKRELGALETRLHDRLCELSELGHDVLVLTKWSGEAIDFRLPNRIEVRSPFKTFRTWEWTRALPMVFAWQPELLHVFDPGLTAFERTLSVEMMAITMMDTLRRASRGRSSYLGGLVSISHENSSDPDSWKRAGAEVIESGWLRAVGADRAYQPWDFAVQRPLRFVLAGEAAFEVVLDALREMQTRPGFELTVFLRRSDLSSDERRKLAKAERNLELENKLAVGRRLRLVDPVRLGNFDGAIVAGLSLDVARSWVERLATPLVLSESLRPLAEELGDRGMRAQVLSPLVSEIAPMAQALALLTDYDRLKSAWSEIEHGALTGGRDVAANHVSRIYSQIARSGATP